MIRSIIFALFFAAANAPPKTNTINNVPGLVCPEKDIAATSGKGPKDCLYPNPESCKSFVQCTVNADCKTGTPVVMPCAPANPPLEWNNDKKECDYPPSPTCDRTKIIAATTETPTEAPTTEPPLPRDFFCPKKDIAATGCKGAKDCKYPYPDNCNYYIKCAVNADNVTGTPIVKSCAENDPKLVWNDKKKECDYPPKSTSKKTA